VITGGDGALMNVKYEHNGRLVHLNKGTKRNEEDGQENGFTLCSAHIKHIRAIASGNREEFSLFKKGFTCVW